ncbi:MAG TPA: hypothetical protein VM580_06945 [Labilithrix sp.]|nr:hypothetical protein [Labilithrix sp.]
MRMDIEPQGVVEPMSTEIIEERRADLRRRRAEAADVLAETLLDMWLRARRSGAGERS